MNKQKNASVQKWRELVKDYLTLGIAYTAAILVIGMSTTAMLVWMTVATIAKVARKLCSLIWSAIAVMFAELWNGFSAVTLVKELKGVFLLLGVFSLTVGITYGGVELTALAAEYKWAKAFMPLLQDLSQTAVVDKLWARSIATFSGLLFVVLSALGYGQKGSLK